MKKKFTRKVRKNRQTKRRKNRSYKRMRGGMFSYKSNLGQKRIPPEVIQIISSSNLSKFINDKTNELIVEQFLERYNTLINDTQLETTINSHVWRSKTEINKIIEEIRTEIKNFTSKTGEQDLQRLSGSTKRLEVIIGELNANEFLPKAEEITGLFILFKDHKDRLHKKPFKFNGLALALAIMKISDKYIIIRAPSSSPLPSSPLPSPPPSSSPDTTNMPQNYIFVFNPNKEMSWEELTDNSIPSNPFCHLRRRIRMCHWNGSKHPFGEQKTDRELATYDTIPIGDGVQLKPEVNRKIQTGVYLITDQTKSTKPNVFGQMVYNKTKIVDTRQNGGGEYKFYRIEKRTQYIDFTDLRYYKLCNYKIYIQVDIETVYEYDEDGIINWVYISFQHKGVVDRTNMPAEYYCHTHHTTPSKAVYDEVIGSMEKTLKLGLNPRVTDIHKVGELEPLIDLTIEIHRVPFLPQVAATGSPIRYTLVMNTPGKWDIRLATPTQHAAFNKVNQYLTEKKIESYDMLQIKRFRVSNNGEGADEIMVIIEVKEMNPGGTLKRAICMGETLSQFEVLDTHASAIVRKNNKEANFNWVTSSGPGGW